MKRNVGKTEAIVRVVIGLGIFGLGIVYQTWWGLLGFIPLITAGSGYCPVWAVLGIDTSSKGKSEA